MINSKAFNKLKHHFEEDKVHGKFTFCGTGEDKNTPFVRLKTRFKRLYEAAKAEAEVHRRKRNDESEKAV